MLLKLLNDKWLRTFVLLLMLALLANQFSTLIWNFFPNASLQSANASTQVANLQGSSDSARSYQQQAAAISRTYLFGKIDAEIQTTQVATEDAPETKLNYKLRGIYFSPEPKLSAALVEVKANKTEHFIIDEELAKGITLASVEVSHIILNRYGKLERLNLEKKLPGKAGAIIARASGSLESATAHSNLLRKYKKRFSNNPMALATRFQAVPVQKDGRNLGFKLKALRGEKLLKKLGFEKDDVFTAVNNIGLDKPFEALDALRSLTTAQSVSVTILRNGKEQTIDFSL